MNAPFAQETRPGRLETVFSKDALVLTSLDAEEALNGLFDFHVQCVATHSEVDFDTLIGTHATVFIDAFTDDERAFDGVVTEVRWLGLSDSGDTYWLRLQPWLFLASLRRNQRIFHNKTVVQIVEQIFLEYTDIGKFDVRLSADYPQLEYTVQYGESDMTFVIRMLERHGICYHFEHDAGAHTLVLSDWPGVHNNIGARPYKPHEGHHLRESGHIRQWRPARRVTTGAIRLTDYNFKAPYSAMEASRSGDAAHAFGQIESFDYPGDYKRLARGNVVADLRSKAERGQSDRFEAEGDIVSLRAGTLVTLQGDLVPGHGDEYLCLSAKHQYRANAYRTKHESADEQAYTGRYVLMPSDRPMVPELKTPRAMVHGPQTAVVVGEGEIDCDEYGRILVLFHWDLARAFSMRCRVSQNWASKGWGGMVIPRIGMEVIVEYLEGDPDKPIVTGCVYNGANPPPYNLPEHKTKSVFKTDTHTGQGFNELTFEDAKDEEKIFMHGQKDHEIVILNDRAKSIGNDQSESVGRDKSISVGRDHKETIGQDAHRTVNRDDRTKIIRNSERQVDKDSFDYVNNQRVEYTHSHFREDVGGDHNHRVEGALNTVVGRKIYNRTKLHVLQAEDKFIIGGPGGTIEITSSGVTIRAKKIDLKSPSINQSGGGPGQIESVEAASTQGLDLAEVCSLRETEKE